MLNVLLTTVAQRSSVNLRVKIIFTCLCNTCNFYILNCCIANLTIILNCINK